MNLRNRNASYSEETLRKQIPDIETWIDPEPSGLPGDFTEYLIGKIGNVEMWFGKLPSGRYVYDHCWASYSLRQLI